MKAISLWQPWASLIVLGEKKIETRSWYTAYRFPVLIHAAKRKNLSEMEELAEYDEYVEALQSFIPADAKSMTVKQMMNAMPYGAIIGKATLSDCRTTRSVTPELSKKELMLGNYEPGRYAWILKNPVMFKEPIPYKGEQGFFNVPDELIESCTRDTFECVACKNVCQKGKAEDEADELGLEYDPICDDCNAVRLR